MSSPGDYYYNDLVDDDSNDCVDCGARCEAMVCDSCNGSGRHTNGTTVYADPCAVCGGDGIGWWSCPVCDADDLPSASGNAPSAPEPAPADQTEADSL